MTVKSVFDKAETTLRARYAIDREISATSSHFHHRLLNAKIVPHPKSRILLPAEICRDTSCVCGKVDGSSRFRNEGMRDKDDA
jgi:hypothetical protein